MGDKITKEKETAKVVRLLWEWIRREYHCEAQERVDKRTFGYDITYKDIRRAFEQLP